MTIMTLPVVQHMPNDGADRIQIAIRDKESIIKANLDLYQLHKDDMHILFVAYKENNELHLYAKTTTETKYRNIKIYPICKRSGTLGPKKAEGDLQVPEGFYHIDRFNPKSKYYLSLGINYPNAVDKNLGYTGSDIFIHGQCETKGCLPMTDELIKEIYLYAFWANANGQQQIPVYIFPFAMTNANIEMHKNQVEEKTLLFWKNIQEGYARFEANLCEIDFIPTEGYYSYR